MSIFLFIAIYLMPAISFVFIIVLLQAIKKIVKGRPYTAEAVWSALLFAFIVYTICISTIITQ